MHGIVKRINSQIEATKARLDYLVAIRDKLAVTDRPVQLRLTERIQSMLLDLKADDAQKLLVAVDAAMNEALDELGTNLELLNLLEKDDEFFEFYEQARRIYYVTYEERLEKILHNVHRVVAALKKVKLPVPVPQPENFIRNNKLPAPDDEEPKRVKTRLPIVIAEGLANVLDLTDKEMAIILTISIRTYHRLKPNGLLNPVASERLSLLKDLAAYGLEVFENQGNFNEWLRLPLQELGNISPLNSLETVTGFNLVNTVLGRIEFGIYS